MRFGCCLNDLNRIEDVDQSGFDFLEVSIKDILVPLSSDKQWERNKKILIKSRLPVEAVNSLLSIKIIGENPNYSDINRYLKNTFNRASSLGAKIIGFGSGDFRSIPQNFPENMAYAQLERFLKTAINYAEKNSINIGLEPLNRKETNLINSLAEAIFLIRRISNPYLKLLADFYHINMENDSLEILNEAKDVLFHIHVSDRNRRCPGSGDYNFSMFFSSLKQMGFDSRISIESRWDHGKELKTSLEFLKCTLENCS